MTEWERHCIAISLLLLAGDVQARVVHVGDEQAGVEVRAEGHRIIWGADDEGRWAWTMVLPDGSIQASPTPLLIEAKVEDVARAIATTMQLVDLPPL